MDDLNRIFDIAIKTGYVLYASVCLIATELWFAVMITPLVILGYYSLTVIPKAVCVISHDRDLALAIMRNIAERLNVSEIHVYQARSETDIKGLAIYDEETDEFYEFEEEDEED